MVGGDEDVFKKAEAVIDCYSRKVKLIGKSGSGQLTKDDEPNVYSRSCTRFIRSY